jgi:hypothetical protein
MGFRSPWAPSTPTLVAILGISYSGGGDLGMIGARVLA